MKTPRLLLGLALFLTANACTADVCAAEQLKVIEVAKIWDAAPHNAFTDLELFKGEFFCAFREGKAHVSPDGAVRVLRSRDGKGWSSAARVTHPLGDLRDPKIVSAPNDELMLLAALATREGTKMTHRSFTWFSKDGVNWGEPTEVGEKDVWIWRAVWHVDRCYGIGYSTDKHDFARLYEGNGREFKPSVPEFFSKAKHGKGYPNEAALVFTSSRKAITLLRRDADTNTGQLGTSMPPYRDWEWKDCGVRIGGPEMIQLDDGRLLAAVRLYDGGARTSLAWVDPATAKITEDVKLPSGGDTSYAGMEVKDGFLWVSYYSSHEGKTSIYFAKVSLPQ